MITERKALQEIFDDLQREKKELKANYREDINRIEERQERLLNRLERLDGIEREAIDPEGLLNDLTGVIKTLGECIPNIPPQQLIDATAEKMAAVAIESGAQVYKSELKADKNNQDIKEFLLEEAKNKNIPRPNRVEDVITEIEKILSERPHINAKAIEKELKKRFGWEWTKFPAIFYKYRHNYPNNIVKKGQSYSLRSGLDHGENRDQHSARDGQTDIKPEDQTI